MKRSIRFGMLLVAVFTVFLAITSRTTAQVPIPNACCTFTVDVAGFPAACFAPPVTLTTLWAACPLQNNIIPGNGIFVFPITACGVCPPVPATFSWGSLDGGINKAWFNFPHTFNMNGCCATIRIATVGGCIRVYLRPGTPPC